MNFVAVIILVTIIGDFILNRMADYMNLKSIRADLPREFEGFYDKAKYEKSQKYLQVNTSFGQLTALFDLIILLVFWFAGGFVWIDQLVRSFHLGPVKSGLIFIGILVLLKGLISLPFGMYSTFVIEERFGFNKTTWSTYIKDLIKGLALGLILGMPLLAGVLGFFEYAGNNAWWLCWIVVTLFMLIIQFIVPTWLMPLFNKFTPLEEGELKDAIFAYARSINFSLKNVFVMDGSKRSAKSNAFFTGFGRNKRIVLFDTLIDKHTTSELVAVLAHEMGHYKKKHILKMMLIGILQTGLLFFILSFFISYKTLFSAFYVENVSVYAGLIFFGMLYSPIEFFMGIFMQKFSRKNEYEADKFAVDTVKDPEAMINALKKLSVDNLSNLLPHPLYVFLHYSHPPILQRITAIEREIIKKKD